MTDLRDVCFSSIRDLMSQDDRVVIVTIDLGAFVLDEIIKEFPDRVINVGIAEQLGISCAAGLAIVGKKPFVYGISMILVRRALAQINMDIGCNNLPVVILGLGAGKSFLTDGPSHCGTEDIAIMETVPNLHIKTTRNEFWMKQAIQQAYDNGSPTYIRFDK